MASSRRSPSRLLQDVEQVAHLFPPFLGQFQFTMDDQFFVTCPYCGESVEIYLESDVRGTLIQDCEVCCNPWRLRVFHEGDDRWVDVARADGSE
jgi:Cysteine-rich CPXCG